MSTITQEPRSPDPLAESAPSGSAVSTPTPLPPRGNREDEEIRAPSANDRFEMRTLAELGMMLPVGIVVNGQRIRPFRLRPMRVKEEKLLGKVREERKGMTMGEFIARVLALMVQTVGPHTFDTMGEKEKRLIIAQLSMADVLYMYLYLRGHALGLEEPVPLQLTCPKCQAQFRFDADLGSIEVRCVPDGELNLRLPYKLRDGIEVHGKTWSTLITEPLKWGSFEKREFSATNPAEREIAVLRHAVVGIEGLAMEPFMLQESDLDMMTKYDMEGVSRHVEDNGPGPMMVVEATCQGPQGDNGCGKQWIVMIDWSYDTFFSRASSQPAKRRR